MRKLKQFTFVRKEYKEFGHVRYNCYICHNGEKEVKKSKDEMIRLIIDSRVDLTMDQFIALRAVNK